MSRTSDRPHRPRADRPTLAPAGWVPLLQALVARELVEQEGLSLKRAADPLGLAPSAVSQYLSGRRQARHFAEYSQNDAAQRLARDVAHALLAVPPGSPEATSLLLDGARRLARVDRPPTAAPGGVVERVGPPAARASREMSRWLRHRIRAEQSAVTACMVLAQRARDEVTRAIFRQIASDSLRHAEIVASLATYLDRGVSGAYASGITRRDVESLIEAERRAESHEAGEGFQELRGTLAVLVESMEDDERKHTALLEGLLRSGFAAPRGATRGRRRGTSDRPP